MAATAALPQWGGAPTPDTCWLCSPRNSPTCPPRWDGCCPHLPRCRWGAVYRKNVGFRARCCSRFLLGCFLPPRGSPVSAAPNAQGVALTFGPQGGESRTSRGCKRWLLKRPPRAVSIPVALSPLPWLALPARDRAPAVPIPVSVGRWVLLTPSPQPPLHARTSPTPRLPARPPPGVSPLPPSCRGGRFRPVCKTSRGG